MVPLYIIKFVLIALSTTSPCLSQSLPPFSQYIAPYNVELAPGTELTWVRGGGATVSAPFFSAMVPLSMMLDSSVYTSYAEVGSSRGACRLCDFLSQCKNPWANTGNDTQQPTSLDFAVVTEDLTASLHAKFFDVSLFPVAASAAAIVHDIPGLTAPLVLSRTLLAQVFRQCDPANSTYCQPGYISQWNNSAILALNPGQEEALQAAGTIRIVVRSDSAGG